VVTTSNQGPDDHNTDGLNKTLFSFIGLLKQRMDVHETCGDTDCNVSSWPVRRCSLHRRGTRAQSTHFGGS
jgi:predicted ATPase